MCQATRDAHRHYSVAKGYLQAAFVILNSPDRYQAANDSTFFLSVHLLWGFALELYLKSFLVFRGASEKQLRQWGHNLAEVAEEAQRQGFASAEIDNLVKFLGESHQGLGYRYPKADDQFPVPIPNQVFGAFLLVDTAVDTAIGASAAHGRISGAPAGAWTLAPEKSQLRL